MQEPPLVTKRIEMTATLGDEIVAPVPGSRRPAQGDKLQLAQLMLAAYAGTVDSEEETLDEALAEIERTNAGEYGSYLPEHSIVVFSNGLLVSAALITLWREQPFVAFTMTHPTYQRQGLARQCIRSAMGSLCAAGYREVNLVVTLANEHAHRLYLELGFVSRS